MMKVDPLDREDILLIFENAKIKPLELTNRIKDAICPDIEEIKCAFEANNAWLREKKII